jgi:hypothetical protein
MRNDSSLVSGGRVSRQAEQLAPTSNAALSSAAIGSSRGVARRYASELLIFENTVLTAFAIPLMPEISASEIMVSINAYSTRSWPSSRNLRSWKWT